MRNVLLITEDFPPSSGIAAQRMIGFARHLPAAGWQPHVLCIDWTQSNTMTFDPALDGCDVTKRIAAAIPHHRVVTAKGGAWKHALALIKDPQAFVAKVGNRISSRWEYLYPADFTFGGIRAFPRLVSNHRIDAVVATAPMLASFVIADWGWRHCGIPWIADFRDVFEQSYITGSPSRQRHLLAAERRLVKTAAAITTVSEPLAVILRDRYRQDVRVVSNGYDPADIAAVGNPPPFSKFTITYAGKLYPGVRDPSLLFAALSELIRSNRIDAERLDVVFLGSDRRIVEEAAAAYPEVAAVVRVEPRLPRHEALVAECRSHVLLHLSHRGETGIMTGKIFEYLATGVPVLTVPGDGDVVDALLAETEGGISGESQQAITDYLACEYAAWAAGRTTTRRPPHPAVARYSRERSAQALATCLDAVVADEQK